ncbi:aryl-alcohol dehydrogenase-like predicted oxidoreductase [Pullulanibacillus pueri]|uniref:Oxidoreductase ion channel protein IolS n=1 Tax=Pullulanibacillus pueri TaxID=1437324 RepID=A0A8J3EKZ9_9BACL|nr:aldo/keto reductase [Pullulanibacillus pueri]MBM7681362.1 aryl-alcohol dehydrogenase-like predicted oxidoreductase [Pullulanibacillus pueri]GGH77451.1 oxidoreductase ion channel protein IolS [Pullulanibacillus pueri]
MDYTQLKKTDMKISTIGLGTNKVGGHNYFKDLSEKEGKDFVKEAINLGINFLDTADVYGHGRSEELIGEVLKEISTRRDELIIATKGANQWDNAGNVKVNNHPDYLRSALEASLKRLGTDYVDLYYLHFPDNVTPLAESLGELTRLKEEGKIRAIGVSNLNIDQLKEADQVAEVVALQSGYNMIDRSVETDVLPYCAENNISFIPYFPLAAGLLSGKYTTKTTFEEGDSRKQRFTPEKLAKAEQLKAFADSKNTTLPNFALAWLLAQKGVDAVIPGGRNPEQIQGVVQALEVKLTPSELQAIAEILN